MKNWIVGQIVYFRFSYFANLKDLQNRTHCFSPLPKSFYLLADKASAPCCLQFLKPVFPLNPAVICYFWNCKYPFRRCMTGLIEKLIAGDKAALEALYRQYYKRVYLFAAKQTKDAAQIEDLVHDIFLHLWENRSRLSLEIPIEAQLFVTARQVVINFLKRSTLQQKVYDNLPLQENNANASNNESDAIEMLSQLTAAIEALPPKRRQIFKMSKLEGLTYEEIAEALSISKNTVESQMVKALRFLRERLSQLPFF